MVTDLEQATPIVAVGDRFAALGLTAFGAEHLAWWSYRWGEAAGVSLRFPYMEKEYVDYLGTLANRPPDSPGRRLDEHRTGRQNHKWSIWTVLCYLIWKREFLETLPVTR